MSKIIHESLLNWLNRSKTIRSKTISDIINNLLFSDFFGFTLMWLSPFVVLPTGMFPAHSHLTSWTFSMSSQTALLYAAKQNQHLMVADLISLGANINETNNWGKSCLHLSAENGYIRVLEVRISFSSKRSSGFGLSTISQDSDGFYFGELFIDGVQMMRLLLIWADKSLGNVCPVGVSCKSSHSSDENRAGLMTRHLHKSCTLQLFHLWHVVREPAQVPQVTVVMGRGWAVEQVCGSYLIPSCASQVVK